MARAPKKNDNKADIDINEDMDDFGIDDDFEDALEPKKKANKRKRGMFSKEKKYRDEDSSRGGIIAFTIILLLMIGFVVGILFFNLFGLRDNQLRDMLEKVPIVNNLLPPKAAEDPHLQMNTDELLVEISKLTEEKNALSTELARTQNVNSDYLEQIRVLKEFEQNQVQFRHDKEAFDREVGFGNTVGYENYYKQISPENAESIYREVIGINNQNAEFKRFVSTYENMDETSAARIFDQMVRTDLDLVVNILENISSEHRAAILAAMTTNAAEQATRRMAPQNY